MSRLPDVRSKGQYLFEYQDYLASDIDETTTTYYYGLLSVVGSWIIFSYDTTSGTVRVATGARDYPENWTNRAGLVYVYYNEVF